MKAYVKPAMMALSISANDALCSTCAVKTRFEPAISEDFEMNYLNGVNDGIFTEEEAKSVGLFDAGPACTKIIDQYCKFVSVDELKMFTS